MPLPPVAEHGNEQDAKLAAFKKYRDNAWLGWTDLVRTEDPSQFSGGPQRVPDYPYLQLLHEVWKNERLISIYKSRRMMMSWYFVWLLLHLTMFHESRLVFFVSKKEENSDELVKRAEFIYDNIPDELLPVKPAKESKYCHLAFPELRSKIIGVPAGSDQLRQFASSGILFDEFAFWKQAEESYKAAIATVEKTGRFIVVSTVQPGFFYEFCMDMTDYAGSH
jgi:hypothetical protein